jgi:acyl-CoA synthetase (AMP-forming)/AMP-acid ligase II
MLTMCSTIERTVRLFGPRPAIHDDEGTLTWSEFGERIAKAAAALSGLGIKPGDRFGIIAGNSFRQAELIHAGYWMGAVSVPLNYRLAPSEMAFILRDSDCGVLAVEDQFLPLIEDENFTPWRARTLVISPKPLGYDLPDYENLLSEVGPALSHFSDEDDDAILL